MCRLKPANVQVAGNECLISGVSVHAKRQNPSQKFNHNGSAYAINPPAVQVSLRRLESISSPRRICSARWTWVFDLSGGKGARRST